MHLETVFPLIFRRRSESRIVRRERHSQDILVWLKGVLSRLKTAGEEDWNSQIEITKLHLSEMQETQGYQKSRTPSTEHLELVILNIRAMMVAMKQRDREMALEMGRAAASAMLSQPRA